MPHGCFRNESNELLGALIERMLMLFHVTYD